MSHTNRKLPARFAHRKMQSNDLESGLNRHAMSVWDNLYWDSHTRNRINKYGRDGHTFSRIYVDGWKEWSKSGTNGRRYWKRKVHVDRRRNEDHERIQEGLDS